MDGTSNLRFLVVGEIASMRRVIRNVLKEMGYGNADEADGGEDALAKLAEGGFDFVLADLNMPQTTGVELLRRIRGDTKLARLPVLLLADEARREDIVAAAQAGASGCVVKPFTRGTLEERIERIVRKLAPAP